MFHGDQTGGRIGQLSLSQKAFEKKQLDNLESCFTALGSECLESSSLLSLHRPCGGDDAT